MRAYDTLPQLTDTLPAVTEAIESADVPVRCVGGLPTDLLLASGGGTMIVPERTIEVSHADAPLYRPNGTVRDIDFLCLTDDEAAIKHVYRALEASIARGASGGLRPKLSVSGYEKAVKSGAYLQLLSQNSKQGDEIHMSVGPIDEVMDAGIFEEDWTIAYQGARLPIFHPIAHMLSYRTRSIAGTRPKDMAKVSALEQYLGTALPADEFERFDAFMRLEERLRDTLGIKEAMRRKSPQYLTLSLAKIAVRHFESSQFLTKQAQDQASLVHQLASRVVKHSRRSFNG